MAKHKIKCNHCGGEADHSKFKTRSDCGNLCHGGWWWKEWVCKCGKVAARVDNNTPPSNQLYWL